MFQLKQAEVMIDTDFLYQDQVSMWYSSVLSEMYVLLTFLSYI